MKKSAVKHPPREPRPAVRPRRLFPWKRLIVVLLPLLVGGAVFADWWTALPDSAQATYVGRQQCISCHQNQNRQWEGSHHDLAMDHATEKTVLGDFSDAVLEHQGITSKMFRQAGKFYINTEGPDGSNADFEIKYVLGVAPLQQYMVEFDRAKNQPTGEVARLQVLRVSWNTEKQEWFHLPPPDVKERLAPDDDLHWTGIAQRWNNMCADCHTTNLEKKYDATTKIYHTTFTEIDVSCETCHGPGSLHVQLAKAPSLFWDRKRGYALAKLKDKDTHVEIETCANCHSRRQVVRPGMPGGARYENYFTCSLLTPPVYHADGQQTREEAYEYGSFLQSKMYHKGVRCSDCHNPHSTKLKFQGNQLCTSCHAHPAHKYDTFTHHRHKDNSAGAKCVECHMPATTYMDVDPRRDHSLRIRPDLSRQLGLPNACTGCHIRDAKFADVGKLRDFQTKDYSLWLEAAKEGDQEIAAELKRLDAWSDQHVAGWFGEQRKTPPHFATALTAQRRGERNAREQLVELLKNRQMPAIARATAAQELGAYVGPGSGATSPLKAALKEENAQIRLAAAIGLRGAEVGTIVNELAPLLSDPVRSVRIEAAHSLAPLRNQLSSDEQRAFDSALEELKASLLADNDRAIAHVSLGSIYEGLGFDSQAEEAYRLALQVEPNVTGPRSNLAGLLNRQGDRLQENIKRAAKARDEQGVETYAEQLRQIEAEYQKLRREEAALLARDAKLAPTSGAIHYRLALALILVGKRGEAEAALRKAVELEPQASQFAYALAIYYKDTEQPQRALPLVDRLLAHQPGNLTFKQLRDELLATPSQGPPPEQR